MRRTFVLLSMLSMSLLCAMAATPVHSVSGTVLTIDGPLLTVKTRTGTSKINVAAAGKAEMIGLPLTVGAAVVVIGNDINGGVLQALTVSRAKTDPKTWPKDK
jgi:hypothetical protein